MYTRDVDGYLRCAMGYLVLPVGATRAVGIDWPRGGIRAIDSGPYAGIWRQIPGSYGYSEWHPRGAAVAEKIGDMFPLA
jgi:hypothetical protein